MNRCVRGFVVKKHIFCKVVLFVNMRNLQITGHIIKKCCRRKMQESLYLQGFLNFALEKIKKIKKN